MSLFTVPIPSCGAHPGGSITVTEPQPRVYLLTFVSPPDNRITTVFCRALMQALDILEFGDFPPGVVITTSGTPKFYSNGLDLEHAINTDGFWQLFYDLYPMPTVALLNGHTFAGGLMLAQAHDYRLAPDPKGFLCLNEVLFGAPLRPPMAAIFRHRLTPQAYRTVALEGRRVTGQQAVEYGLADATAASVDDALAFVSERQLTEKAKPGVYGVIKAELHKDLLRELRKDGVDAEDARFDEDRRRDAERKEFGKVWFEQWSKENKSKL
ncbi:enoyl-CoA hydratase/isomerase family protein [Metarhizium album ARSEF 1941]|uniref:Enoyl-CoA hydratase/isomerase family protein n=1 Tax=Metarhizium album (strain ARSEF 1941) TaxID=1081103 RepID=A0A0B2WPB8_METAS|nr:enoyl-CoA hydratase/isomerase family protein [Metarhizium album ARSEF 1941]KHN95504.1 enoyl-CoA hydratase/isomerase family protein [Metarhizium album ARSEF 1941]